MFLFVCFYFFSRFPKALDFFTRLSLCLVTLYCPASPLFLTSSSSSSFNYPLLHHCPVLPPRSFIFLPSSPPPPPSPHDSIPTSLCLRLNFPPFFTSSFPCQSVGIIWFICRTSLCSLFPSRPRPAAVAPRRPIRTPRPAIVCRSICTNLVIVV